MVHEEATQSVGPREEAFKDDKSDENVYLKTLIDDFRVIRMNLKNFLQID